MRLASLCIAVSLLVVTAAPAMAASHPHLLFSSGDVASLQQRAQGTHKAYAQPFLGGVAAMLGNPPPGPNDLGDPREAPDMLVPLAMAAVLVPDAAHVQQARAHLDALLSWGDWQYGQGVDLAEAHFAEDVAIAYDWLYPQLTDSEKSSVIARLSTACNDLFQASQTSWWSAEYTQNHNWANNAALGTCALALEGDIPAATTQSWLQVALADLTQVSKVLDAITDGTWHEGPGYQANGVAEVLPFLEMLRQTKGQDLTNLGMLRAFSRFQAANMVPGAPRQYLLDTGDTFGWASEGMLEINAWAARRFHDPVAAGVAQTWLSAAPLSTYVPDIAPEVFAFLFFDPTVAAADLNGQPLDQRFTDMQAVLFRSAPGASSVLVGLKTGPYAGEATFARLTGAASGPIGNVNVGHDHADDNGFYLYGNGQFLVPEAAGYNAGSFNAHPPAQLSRYHNTLLVDGAGQLGEDRTQDDENNLPWATTRAGGITRGASTASYAFAEGDAAKMYPAAAGLSKFGRQVLMVNRQYAVVRDVIDSSGAHSFSQAWHFLDGASASGGWVKGVAKSNQLVGVRVVSPADFAFSTQTLSPDNVQHLDPDGAITEADVSTPSTTNSARMLSVFWPSSTSTWDARPTIDAISATTGAGYVLTQGGHLDKVVLHDEPTAHSTEGDLEVAGLGGVVALDSGKLTHALLLDGTKLVHQGLSLIELPVSGTVEIAMTNGTLALTGESVNMFKVYAPGVSGVTVNGHAVAFAQVGETVVVPPPGQTPGATAALVATEHPIWRSQTDPSGPAWSAGGASWSGSSTSEGSSGPTLGWNNTPTTTPAGTPAEAVKGHSCASTSGLELLALVAVAALGLRRRRTALQG